MICYIVLKPHISEFPNPLSLEKGEALIIGEKYEGSEGWDDWCFCKTAKHTGGWVPAQIIRHIDANKGEALQTYTAKELNVNKDEEITGGIILNGWTWCCNSSGDEGWVPLDNLTAVSDKNE